MNPIYVTPEVYQRVVALQSEMNTLQSQIRWDKGNEAELAKQSYSDYKAELINIAESHGIVAEDRDGDMRFDKCFLLSDRVALTDEDHRQTYTVKKYSVWDRKSPRHDWQLVTNQENSDSQHWHASNQLNKIRAYGKWPQGQVAILTYDYYYRDGSPPDTLAKNSKMDQIIDVDDTKELA